MNYYKQRNSNETMEYDVVRSLNRIEKLISDKNEDFICSIVSALFANAFTQMLEEVLEDINTSLIFIVFMLMAFILLKIFFQLIDAIKNWKKSREPGYKKSDEKQLDLRNVFYCKIANEIIFAESLINRVCKLRKQNKKEDLWRIYLFQAKSCLERAGKLLHDSVYTFDGDAWEEYVDLIGKDAIIWMRDSVIAYSYMLKKLEPNIDIDNGICYVFKQLKVKEKTGSSN